MWIVFARSPRPLAHVWHGRIPLAVADAVAWPAAWVYAVLHLPVDGGLLGRVSVAISLLLGVRRTWTALWENGRYRFLTWRLWSLTWPVLALAVALQIAFWLAR